VSEQTRHLVSYHICVGFNLLQKCRGGRGDQDLNLKLFTHGRIQIVNEPLMKV